jgi:uncharacterized membrane protein
MKSILNSITLCALLAGIAQAQPQHRYTITNLGRLLPSGWSSQATVIDNAGVVTGVAVDPEGVQHAVIWVGGQIVDISAPGLGGPNSGAAGFNRGQAVGQAESSGRDPGNENFCGYGPDAQGAVHKCLPFLWQAGRMTQLQTLGGNNGAAGPINHRG